jgi:predicted regulator of Ras-like GTPase activity (Roadblock/LC7/MglB family)
MLSFIEKIFGSSKGRTKAIAGPAAHPAEPAAQMPAVEVAHLRLAAILGKFPDELKPLVLRLPEDSVTVALPVSTILRQLPSGSVKVSLATLHRQAPAGVLGPLPPGDRQMVEVPLAEVFRHIKATAIKRRSDQRAAPGLESDFNLFGNVENPFQIAPTAPDERPRAIAPGPISERGEPLTIAVPAEIVAAEEFVPELLPPPTLQRTIAAPPELYKPKLIAPPPRIESAAPPAVAEPKPLSLAAAPEAPAPPPSSASIELPVEALSSAWPEAIRHELAALNGSARITLPAAEITAGLARGRVAFPWGKIRGWIEPRLDGESSTDAAAELTLPLKIVAPAFLAATRKTALPPKPAFETDIPALFNPTAVEAPAPAPPIATPETLPPAAAAPEPVVAPPREAATIGEVFGQPEKAEWTPAEIVTELARLPGISGAVVALQEGLLVAHSLPAEVKSEVIAAFLPQLFARLNQYAGEMKLGEVDDLLFTTHGAHCQIYRVGYVYFAVLGKPGEALPWTHLRLVVDELKRHTHP